MSPADELRCLRQLLLQVQQAPVVTDEPTLPWVAVRLRREDWHLLQLLYLKDEPHHG